MSREPRDSKSSDKKKTTPTEEANQETGFSWLVEGDFVDRVSGSADSCQPSGQKGTEENKGRRGV